MFRNSASLLAILLTMGPAWAIQVDKESPTPVTTIHREDLEKIPNSDAVKQVGEIIAHNRTMEAAKKVQAANTAKAAAMCTRDKALQQKMAQAAEDAQKELESVAGQEVDHNPLVDAAHNAAINATIAQERAQSPEDAQRLKAEADAKWDSYDTLRNGLIKSTIDAALKAAVTPQKAGCPANRTAPAQRDANSSFDPIPPLPASAIKGIGMLQGFNDSTFKATLAQPSVRPRVEVILNLEGCNWNVNPGTLRQAIPQRAGSYLNSMTTPMLRQTLTDFSLQGRIDTVFDRRSCGSYVQPETPPVSAVPQNNPNRDDGPYPYPYGYPQGDYGRGDRPGDRVPGVPYGTGDIPYGRGGPYGGYGGYNW